jgi:hypothetical protein
VLIVKVIFKLFVEKALESLRGEITLFLAFYSSLILWHEALLPDVLEEIERIEDLFVTKAIEKVSS